MLLMICVGDTRGTSSSVPQIISRKEDNEGLEKIYADHEDHCKYTSFYGND